MRIVRVKLEPNTSTLLEAVSRRYRIVEAGFAEDLYSLIRTKGNGLPDSRRIDKLAAHYAKGKNALFVKAAINKRVVVLKQLVALGMFQQHAKNPIRNDMDFLEDMLLALKDMFKKVRKAQCLSCSLLNKCDFGKQYGTKVQNIEQVVDPDYTKKVHDDCPHKPEITMINEMYMASLQIGSLASQQGAAAMTAAVNTQCKDPMFRYGPNAPQNPLSAQEVKAMQQAESDAQLAAEESVLDGSSAEADDLHPEDTAPLLLGQANTGSRMSNVYDTAHGTSISTPVDRKVIERISVSQLVLFELSRKLTSLLDKHKKGAFKPVEKLTKHRTLENIKSISEAAKATPSQHALPAKIFDAKAVKHQLIKQQQQDPDQKKQLLHVLLDTSGSMCCLASRGTGDFAYASRANLAASFVLSLLKRVQDDKGILYLRCFAGGAGRLYECRTKEDFERLADFIATCGFNGGSTNIPAAVKSAASDINNANKQSELARAEILLISDAEDTINANVIAELRNDLKQVAINVLDVAGRHDTADPNDPQAVLSTLSEGAAAKALMQIADNYFKVDPSKTLVDMISIVGGKKKIEPTKKF